MPLARIDAQPVTPAEFAAWMAPLGPFEPAPALAVAVSGGADSLALALCARDWALACGGSVLALVADHGLRATSASEAAETCGRLAAARIPSEMLRLHVPLGSALAARAREARHAALTDAAAGRGILHLLLGHHAGDQAETLLIRVLAASGPAGLAGMAALRETGSVRLLRPLLAIPPARLRATLTAAGIGWVEDPSNRNLHALRARIRAWRDDAAGTGRTTRLLGEAAAASGTDRAVAEIHAAVALARVTIRPEGFAVLPPGPIAPDALAALLQAIGGRRYPAASAAIAGLAAEPRPATLGGVRLMRAGRLGPGWLLLRETAAMDPPVPARMGEWDGRFRLTGWRDAAGDHTIGALRADAARFRDSSHLPAAVLRTLPALRRDGAIVAVPAIGVGAGTAYAAVALPFAPPRPAAAAPFLHVMFGTSNETSAGMHEAVRQPMLGAVRRRLTC